MKPSASPCINCAKTTRQVNAWHAVCSFCGLYASTLGSGSGTGVDGLEHLRRENFEHLLDQLGAEGPLTDVSAMEVGCSQGFFMEAARARGMNIQGIEPETAMADKARAKGFTVREGFFPDVLETNDTFDLIIFNDVFEHLPTPQAALVACEAHLKLGGRLVINIPSSDGVLFRLAKLLWRMGAVGPYERMWQKDFPSPHTFYFNSRNLRALAETHTGLQQAGTFRLHSVHRKGMRARVAATYSGPIGLAVTTALWVLSYGLPFLPADIHVASFVKRKAVD